MCIILKLQIFGISTMKENIKKQDFTGKNLETLEANINQKITELGDNFISQQLVLSIQNT